MFSYLLDEFKAGKNIDGELYDIQHSFFCYSKYGTKQNVDIIDIADGFSYYLAFLLDNFLIFDKNAEASLTKILEVINQFQPTDYQITSVGEIKNWLEIIHDLGYMKIINSPRKLTIACIPYKKGNNHSGYNLFSHLILCSSTEASKIHPYFIFLHEVGHAFVTNLNIYKKNFNMANDLKSLPLSLTLLLEPVSNWSKDFYNWSETDKNSEVFIDFAADMFAAVVCHSSEDCQKYIPEYLKKDWLIEIFSYYFNEIISLNNIQEAFSSRFWNIERKKTLKSIIDIETIAM